MWIGMGILTVLLIIALLYFQRRQLEQRQQVERLVGQLHTKALQAQMNPHFIFNALNAIQQFILESDQETAMVYLSRFARLIRMIFEYSKRISINLEEETEFLELYLKLEKLRFGDKIQVHFEVADELDDDIKLPPLLVQPIIENSFKHGLLHKGAGGQLWVTFSDQGEYMQVVVEDNGIGREAAKAYSQWRENHNSSGVDTTYERLQRFNEDNHPPFEVTDLTDENNEPSGTRTTLRIRKHQG